MEELYKMRAQIYRDIKNMSRKEIIDYFCSGADKFREKLKQFQNTQSEIDATQEIIRDKAFVEAIYKGLKEIEQGKIFTAKEVIEDA